MLADLVEELGLAIRGAAELLAALDAGLLGDEVRARAPLERLLADLEVAVGRDAILVGIRLVEYLAELVRADVELALRWRKPSSPSAFTTAFLVTVSMRWPW